MRLRQKDAVMGISSEIITLWKKVERAGIDDLITWLEGSDFFAAPCSTNFHLNRPGGLAEHSLNVYNLLKEKVLRYEMDTPEDSVIICGLGHDLCKVNFYGKGKKNIKENGTWKEKEVYLVNDQLPIGHGEKSVSILQDFIKLTDEVKIAIRWHMNSFDASFPSYEGRTSLNAALKKCPLAVLIFTADFEASHMLEID